MAAGHVAGAAGILVYAGLQADSSPARVLLALALVGVGVGVALPANQRTVFALAPRENYGVAGGMLSACGPGAGSVGHRSGRGPHGRRGRGGARAGFVLAAQRLAMLSLLPLPFLGAGPCHHGAGERREEGGGCRIWLLAVPDSPVRVVAGKE